MSKTIDENVVQMKFDNSQFENNVKTTMSTLDKLKSALNFKGSESAFDGLDSAANKLSKNGILNIGSSVETVQAKFSALEVVGATALAKLTSSAMDTGKKIVDALTVNGQRDGFAEYEKIIDATKIIQASSPDYTLEQINGYLEELNEYADKTIYSLSDMTDNIGKFTNAGVDLKDAIPAIQGITNAAALSGSTAAQASHAMYNFSQALSAGYVKLIDWKSIENANMATVEFKEQLLETAEDLGLLKSAGDGTYDILNVVSKSAPTWTSSTAMFNESLAQQWMTTEVLTKTLAKYTNQTTEIGRKATKAATQITTYSKLIDTVKESIGSGWSKSFQLIFGDLEEATELWTNLNNKVIEPFISKISKSRNEALQLWRESPEGLAAVEHGVKNLYGWAMKLYDVISKNYNEAFQGSKSLSDILLDISTRFDKFATTLNSHTIIIDNLGKLIRGIFDLISTGKNVIGGFFSIVKHLIESIYSTLGGQGGLIGLVGDLGDGMSEVANMLTKSDIDKFVASINKKIDEIMPKLKPVLKFVQGAIETVIGLVVTLGNTIYDFVTGDKKSVEELTDELTNEPENGNGFINWINKVADSLSEAFDVIKDIAEPFSEFFKAIWDDLKEVGGFAEKALNKVFDGLRSVGTKIREWFDAYNEADASERMKMLTTIGLGFLALYKILDGLSDKKDVFGIFMNPIEGITETIQHIQDAFDAKEMAEKMSIAKQFSQMVLMIAGSLFIVSLIDTERAWDAVRQIGIILGGILAALTIIEKISTTTRKVTSASTALAPLSDKKNGIFVVLQQFLDGLQISLPDFKLIYEMNARAAMVKALALALLAIAGALLIMNYIDLKKAVASAGILLVMISVIACIAYALSKSSLSVIDKDPVANKALGALAIMIGGLYVIADVLQKMDGLTNAIDNAHMLALLVIALGIMSRVMAGSKTHVFGEKGEFKSTAKESMAALLTICAGLYLIARALKKMDGLTNAVQNAVILGALMLVMGVIVVGLTAITSIFGAGDLNGISKFLKEFTKILLSMSLVLLVLDKINGVNGSDAYTELGQLALLAIGLGVFVTAMAGVSHLVKDGTMDDVNKSLLAISTSMVIMSAALYIMGKTFGSNKTKNKAIIAGAIASAVALGVLSAALVLLKDKIDVKAIAAVISVAGAIVIMAYAMKVLSSVGDMDKAIKGMAAVAIALGGIMVVAGLVGKFAPQASIIIFAIDGLVAAIASLGFAFGYIINAVANVMSSVDTFANGLIKLSTISKEEAGQIAENIVTIAEGIGKYWPTLIASFMVGLAEGIAAFAIAIKEKKAEIKEASREVLIATIEGWAEAAPEVTDGICTIINGILEVLIEKLPEMNYNFAKALYEKMQGTALLAAVFGKGIVDVFVNGIKAVSIELENRRTELENSVGVIADVIGDVIATSFALAFGVVSEVIGKTIGLTIEKLAEGILEGLAPISQALTDFISALDPFFEKLRSITDDDLNAAKKLAEIMLVFAGAEFANGIKDFVSNFKIGGKSDTTSLTEFAEQFGEFGKGLSKFYENTKSIDAKKTLEAMEAADGLLSLANKDISGAYSRVKSENLPELGSILADFGIYLKRFADNVSGFGSDVIDSVNVSLQMANNLVSFVKDLKDCKKGITNLGVLGEGLPAFAKNISDYAINVVGLSDNITAVDKSIELCDVFSRLTSSVNELPKNALKHFGTDIKELGSAFVDFSKMLRTEGLDNLRKVTEDFLKAFFDTNEEKEKDFEKAGNTDVENFIKGFNDGATSENMGIAANNVVVSATNKLKSKENLKRFYNAGVNATNSFANGISDSTALSNVSSSAQKVVDEYNSVIGDAKKNTSSSSLSFDTSSFDFDYESLMSGFDTSEITKQFGDIGTYANEGYASGILNNTSLVSDASSILGKISLKSLKKSVDSNSPSKEFMKIGEFCGEGLAIGLKSYSERVRVESESMGEGTIDGISSTISRISDYIQNGLGEESLTITPVLDLSNVSNGIRSINSMFAHDQAMSISANGVNGNSVNGTTLNQILSAIQEFGGFNVVMDTGATVGALAPTMNSALGQISYREARR